ncbi:hypothetical protein PS273GM_00020 [Stutzerimonas stutzeri]|uniref:Uncharacterized protein n=1 Tax=Stutzerimonas stutzeri TaxID=316 RepID=A0A172WJQ2_STUST|nr:hypothetical protein PS273GM_00020 [Stutzerimonas stutzeri]
MAQVRSASLISATRTSSTIATSILRRFSTWVWVPSTKDSRGLRLSLMAAMRSTPSISLATYRPEVLMHLGQLDLAFAYAAVDDGRDQAVLVELEVGEYLGDLQPNLVTGGAFTPEVLCRVSPAAPPLGRTRRPA